MIFRKEGIIGQNESWTYGFGNWKGKLFNYLGIDLSIGGALVQTIKALADKVLNRKEGNDQESIQLPTAFRSKTPKGMKDALKVTAQQSKNYKQKAKRTVSCQRMANKKFNKTYMQRHTGPELIKKGKKKVQGVPRLQTSAPPRHLEEEETEKTKQAQIEQTHEKHQQKYRLGTVSKILLVISLKYVSYRFAISASDSLNTLCYIDL